MGNGIRCSFVVFSIFILSCKRIALVLCHLPLEVVSSRNRFNSNGKCFNTTRLLLTVFKNDLLLKYIWWINLRCSQTNWCQHRGFQWQRGQCESSMNVLKQGFKKYLTPRVYMYSSHDLYFWNIMIFYIEQKNTKSF